MKILFDQNAPRPLAAFLPGHQVSRSAELGWSELENGDLLRAAEEQNFEVMVTADQNLSYQQNLEGRKVALVVLPFGQWPRVKARLLEIVRAIDKAQHVSFTDRKPDTSRRSSRAPRPSKAS